MQQTVKLPVVTTSRRQFAMTDVSVMDLPRTVVDGVVRGSVSVGKAVTSTGTSFVSKKKKKNLKGENKREENQNLWRGASRFETPPRKKNAVNLFQKQVNNMTVNQNPFVILGLRSWIDFVIISAYLLVDVWAMWYGISTHAVGSSHSQLFYFRVSWNNPFSHYFYLYCKNEVSRVLVVDMNKRSFLPFMKDRRKAFVIVASKASLRTSKETLPVFIWLASVFSVSALLDYVSGIYFGRIRSLSRSNQVAVVNLSRFLRRTREARIITTHTCISKECQPLPRYILHLPTSCISNNSNNSNSSNNSNIHR